MWYWKRLEVWCWATRIRGTPWRISTHPRIWLAQAGHRVHIGGNLCLSLKPAYETPLKGHYVILHELYRLFQWEIVQIRCTNMMQTWTPFQWPQKIFHAQPKVKVMLDDGLSWQAGDKNEKFQGASEASEIHIAALHVVKWISPLWIPTYNGSRCHAKHKVAIDLQSKILFTTTNRLSSGYAMESWHFTDGHHVDARNSNASCCEQVSKVTSQNSHRRLRDTPRWWQSCNFLHALLASATLA